MFVAVLVQGQSRAGKITIDQAGIGPEAGIASACGSVCCQCKKCIGHGRPILSAVRVVTAIAVALFVTDPAQFAAVGHGHGHDVSTGCDEVAERGLRHDAGYGCQQCLILMFGEAMQYHRAGTEDSGSVATVAEQVGCGWGHGVFVGGGPDGGLLLLLMPPVS